MVVASKSKGPQKSFGSKCLFFLALALFLDFNDFYAVIGAAIGAHVVRHVRLVALRARHELPGLERQVAAPAIAAPLLNLSLRKSTHWKNSFHVNRFASEARRPCLIT